MSDRIVRFKMKGDISDFQKKWQDASTTMNRLSNKAEEVSRKMDRFGKKMTTSLTLPIVGAAAAGVKAFSSFDKAMTESLAIMGNVSADTRKEMEALAKQLSTESTFSSKQAAESYFFLASAGLDAERSMAALPIVMKFAQAGAFDMAQATDLLTDAYSALGPAIAKTGDYQKDMTRLGDLLVKANTMANASVQQFSEALTNEAAAAMRNYGIEVEDGIAVLAAYADQGIKGQVAGSMFSRSVRLLTQTARENAEEFEKLGIRVFDSSGEIVRFSELAGGMEKAFAGMSTEARVAAMSQLGFQARTQQAIFPLIGASQAVEKYREGLTSAAGITDEVANKQLESLSAQLTIVRNKLVNAGIAIGETLAPYVVKLAERVSSLTEWFTSLDSEAQKNIIKWSLIVAAIGPVIVIVGKVIGIFAMLVTGIKAVGAALMFLAANPVGAAIVAITAAAAAVYKAVKTLLEWRNATRQAAAASRELAAMEEATNAARSKNAERWANDKNALSELNRVMESNLSIQEKIASIQKQGEQYLSTATTDKLQAAMDQLMAQQEEMNKATAEAPASIVQPFQQTEKDAQAALKFEEQMSKAVFDRMDTEGKINSLIEKRTSLVADLEKAQRGSEAYYDIKGKILQAEKDLLHVGESRAAEIRRHGSAQDPAQQFSAAVEKGSAADYSARIRANTQDPAKKVQEEQKKELVVLNKKIQEQVTILREGFASLTSRSSSSDVFVIA